MKNLRGYIVENDIQYEITVCSVCAFIIVQNNKYFVLICSAERRSDTNLSTSHELSSVDGRLSRAIVKERQSSTRSCACRTL